MWTRAGTEYIVYTSSGVCILVPCLYYTILFLSYPHVLPNTKLPHKTRIYPRLSSRDSSDSGSFCALTPHNTLMGYFILRCRGFLSHALARSGVLSRSGPPTGTNARDCRDFFISAYSLKNACFRFCRYKKTARKRGQTQVSK